MLQLSQCFGSGLAVFTRPRSCQPIDLEALLNLPDVRVAEVQLSDQEAHLFCESVLNCGYCPQCWQPTRIVFRYHTRVIRDLSLLGRTVYLHLTRAVLSKVFAARCDV